MMWFFVPFALLICFAIIIDLLKNKKSHSRHQPGHPDNGSENSSHYYYSSESSSSDCGSGSDGGGGGSD